jgi:hypothetical protein
MKFYSIIYLVAIITIAVSAIAGTALYMIDKNADQNDKTN